MLIKLLIFGVLIPFNYLIIELTKTALKEKPAQEEIKEEKISQYDIDKYNRYLQVSDDSCKIWHPYSSFPGDQIGRDMAEKAASQKVVDMPQLSFDQWLTFYQNKPEIWAIEKNQYASFSDIPYYVRETEHENAKRTKKIKNTVYLPIFWQSAEDMVKYRKWVEQEYQQGRAAIYDQARAANLKKLTGYLREDINENREKAQQEFEKYQKQIEQEQKKNITLRLSTGEEVQLPDPVSDKLF